MNPEQEVVALNADVVGYSALVADDVATTTVAMSAYHELVSSHVERNGGTLANFVGDSFMAIFPEAMEALRAAISICKAVEGRNASVPATRQVRFSDGDGHGAGDVRRRQPPWRCTQHRRKDPGDRPAGRCRRLGAGCTGRSTSRRSASVPWGAKP
ncbi:MAG: hypothetical protein OEQ47_10725 [Acidimicrobiia bacterium]|nr:hypothetical protein [Acidimicrobiia bacterium]